MSSRGTKLSSFSGSKVDFSAGRGGLANGLQFYADLWHPNQQGYGRLVNGTGIATPTDLVAGANTVTASQEGTFTINLPALHTGTAASGTATVAGSPVTLTGNSNTITVSGTGTITVTCTDQVIDRANGIIGTITNATWGTQGRTFDGTDDVINAGSPTVLDNLLQNFTICAWIKPAGAGENNVGRVVDKFSTGGFDIFVDSSSRVGLEMKVAAGFKYARSATNSLTYSPATWAFITAEYDGVNAIVSVNNSHTVGDAATGDLDAHADANFLIGDNAGSNRCFNGIIGEVWVYNRLLSLSEDTQIRNATKWRYIR